MTNVMTMLRSIGVATSAIRNVPNKGTDTHTDTHKPAVTQAYRYRQRMEKRKLHIQMAIKNNRTKAKERRGIASKALEIHPQSEQEEHLGNLGCS